MKGSRIARLAALGAGALMASALVGGARAQEGVFMKDLLGSVGIIPAEKPTIAYRERPPLVVPPKADLPAPVDAAGVQARNPEWPNDPDVLERKRREARARVPITEDERRRMSDTNPRVSVDELRAGRSPGAGIPDGPVIRPGNNNRAGFWISPDLLRSQGRTVEEPLVAGVEPERRALTEPPSGFRKPSAKAAIRKDFEPPDRTDEADTRAFIRQQSRQ